MRNRFEAKDAHPFDTRLGKIYKVFRENCQWLIVLFENLTLTRILVFRMSAIYIYTFDILIPLVLAAFIF